MADRDPLADFEADTFTSEGKTRRVFRKGTGPGVMVITEVPGITPYVADFARRVVDAGFTVAMPDFIGEAGAPFTYGRTLAAMATVCISSEFTALKRGQASPITDWMRACAKDLHGRCGGPGVGAIGMCLTGGFALAMAVDDTMLAPVLSQPSLPFFAVPGNGRDLGISDEALATVKRRVDDGLEILGMRFEKDLLCPRARFDRLSEEFGDGFIRIEIPDEAANPRGRPRPPHSVVTTDLIDEPGQPTHDALVRCLDFFQEKLAA
ncbi:MAG: dienelactone hydrolase family protein [Nitriliruptorales bacterium]|nr:dienelactone hydrolase family protein [Nitriliruptorales bacterium]